MATAMGESLLGRLLCAGARRWLTLVIGPSRIGCHRTYRMSPTAVRGSAQPASAGWAGASAQRRWVWARRSAAGGRSASAAPWQPAPQVRVARVAQAQRPPRVAAWRAACADREGPGRRRRTRVRSLRASRPGWLPGGEELASPRRSRCPSASPRVQPRHQEREIERQHGQDERARDAQPRRHATPPSRGSGKGIRASVTEGSAIRPPCRSGSTLHPSRCGPPRPVGRPRAAAHVRS